MPQGLSPGSSDFCPARLKSCPYEAPERFAKASSVVLHLIFQMLKVTFRRVLVAPVALVVWFTLALPAHPSSPQTQDLKGEVVGEKGEPISGAVCSLTSPNPGILPDQGVSQATGEKGEFEFPGLIQGTYDLICAAVGHEPVVHRGLEVTDQPPPFVQIVLPPEIVLRQKIEVREKTPVVAQESTAAAAKLASTQLKALPLAEQKFKAALPLVPGVVRTPDGRINIRGSVETVGMLLVDSADTVDPVTGSFSIEVPIDAVESLEVYKSAYRAEYGRFSGGLTSVHTKPPSGQWHYEFNDFLPTPRIRSGHIVGIADNKPRLSFTGPLWTNRLNFSESFEYDFSRVPVRGLAWPHNEAKTEGFNSFTSFQLIASPHHLITANADLFPLRQQYANINSLVSQSASSNYGQRGGTFGLTDRYLFTSGAVLSTLVQATKFDSNAYGQGSDDMLVTPNGLAGNYFNSWDRRSSQQELFQAYQFPRHEWLGKHDLKIGGDFVHRDFHGTSVSRPVRILRPDGSLAEQVDFNGPGKLAADDIEAAGFIQDHWTFNGHWALDAGLRYSGQTLGEPAAIAPRAGLVFSPGAEGKTIFRAGTGVFYDRVPLLAGDFTDNPTRVVTYFDLQGIPTGPPITYHNAYIKVDEKGRQIVPSRHHLSSTPNNFTWNLELDQEVHPHVLVRLGYLSSRTVDSFVIDPLTLAGADSTLLLTNTGSSRYHEFESTVRVHSSERADLNVSYVWSQARGDLNTLTQVFVPFEQPVIRPNFFGNLPSHVPHRLVSWARFKIPWSMTASPVVDLHTGFPYSNVDVFQNYVGTPNGQRFPTFFSTDFKLTKDFHVPLIGWLKSHRFRLGFQVFNLTNHTNPRDVFSNITSPFFGHFVGLQHRTYDASLDIVY